MRDGGELLEWAEVFGNHYGTPRKPVEETLARAVDRWIRGPIGAMSAEGELARRAASGTPVKVRKAAEGIRVE